MDIFAPSAAPVLGLLGIRLGGLFLIAPIYSSRSVPGTLKAGLIVILSALMHPVAMASAAPNVRITPAIAMTELLIGFALGFGVAILVGAAEAMGDLLAVQIGLSGAAALDPLTNNSVPVLGTFASLFAVTLLLSLDAHTVMLEAVSDSLTLLPMGAPLDLASGITTMVGWGSTLFMLGTQFAGPVIATVLLANVALAVLGRAAPALNVLAVAFPIQIGLGLLVFAASLPLIETFFTGWALVYDGMLGEALGAFAPGRASLMSDSSMQEKTEEATPKKREEAHRDGQIPKSVELNTAVMLLGSALVINTAGPMLGETVLTAFHYGIVMAGAATLDGPTSISLVQITGWKVLAGLGIFLCSLSGVALAISAVQGRGVLSTKPIEPKFERINPFPNAKRMLGVQPWVELAKSLFKLFIVGIAVYGSMRLAWEESLVLAQQAPVALLNVVRHYAVRMLMTAGFAYVILALFDYGYQVWQHLNQMKMSKEDIKQEHKQAEGDPLVKQRMRSMGRSLARRQMFKEVPNADVVITNPTHIAIALRYDPSKADAPMVLAMGERKVAERIKAIAAEAGVPMVENRPLARALLGSSRVGIAIPAELYIAVAEVLAFVIRQRGATGYRVGAGAA